VPVVPHPDHHVAWTYFNQVVCPLRFFYREVLRREWEFDGSGNDRVESEFAVEPSSHSILPSWMGPRPSTAIIEWV
jgi:hypothetical protein